MLDISVVIPVRNEEDSIAALLDGLLSQSLPPTEILITDGGSTDNTRKIVSEYSERDARVRLFSETMALPGRGRNVGASNAASGWLAFIDAGVIPMRHWLERMAECVEADDSIDVVFGSWEPVTNSLLKECAAIAYAYVPNPDKPEEIKNARAVFSSLMRRKVWESVGGFREDLRSAEDNLFINKIDEGGFNTAYAPEALVLWSMQPTLWRTFKRFVTYSRNNLRAGLGKQWQLAIVLRYLILFLIVGGAAFFTRWWAVIGWGLFGVMLAGRAVVALWRNRKRFRASSARTLARFLVLLPLLFTIDLATLAGTLDWLLRDKITGKN